MVQKYKIPMKSIYVMEENRNKDKFNYDTFKRETIIGKSLYTRGRNSILIFQYWFINHC